MTRWCACCRRAFRTHTVYCGIKDGTVEEFQTVMPEYERGVAEVPALKVDLIHPEGTPPFMIHRYAGEQRIVAGWEDKYGIPVFTSGMNQIRAMKALGARRIVGAGYNSITGPIVEQYFRDAGFEVIAIEKVKATWEEVGLLTDAQMIEMMADVFRRHPGGQVMYLQGSKWPSLEVVEELEQNRRASGAGGGRALLGNSVAVRLAAAGLRLRQTRRRDAERIREPCPGFGSAMR